MFETIDWRAVTFIFASLAHEMVVHFNMPRVYYFEQEKKQLLNGSKSLKQ
ncbi:hypothetical protein [Metabacillus idriensis]